MMSTGETLEALTKAYGEDNATFALASMTAVEAMLLDARATVALAIRDGKQPDPEALAVLDAKPSELIAKAHAMATVMAGIIKSQTGCVL